MNKPEMKYLQLIATFMITLVITIPVYSASVFAGIDKVSAKGSDGINGYVKEQDYVTFEAAISTTGNDSVTKEQVWLGQNFMFDSCAADISGYKCSLRYPADGTADWEPRAIPYTINLKENGSITGSKSGTIYVDNLAPKISSFSAEPALVGIGNVKLKYSVEDKACLDSSCSGECSGIKSLELYELNGSYSEIVVVNGSSCSYSSKISRNGSVFGDGEHTIYAKAHDNLGKVSDAASTTLRVDNGAPQIDTASFKITDETGLDIEYASPQKTSVKAYVEISEANLDKDSVRGDFTSVDSSYKDLKASCSDMADSISGCTWPINLAVSEETSKKFVITAKDLVGNEAKIEVAKAFSVDTTGPVVTSIKTDRVKDGKSYARLKNNTFIAEITENVGLNPNQVILHLGGKSIKANNCSAGWTCRWDKVDISGAGTKKASIKGDTTDRLGNKAATFTANIIVDSKLPKLLNLSIGAVGGEEEAVQEYLKTGDSLQIKAVLEDDAMETAYADLSSVIANADNVQADSCASIGSNKWQCSWATTSIDISGFIEDYVNFKFEDAAGNVLKHKSAIKIYGLADGTNVNYWTHEVECSPKLIDRQTTSLINQKVFCHVKLEPLQSNIVPLSISLGSCSNDTTAIQTAELFNTGVGITDPYLKFVLKKSKFNVDAVDLNCPLHITTKIGNTITATPEEEKVAVKLEFYNMPLGEISDEINNKIKDAIDDANEGVWKVITGAKKIIFYAERICQMLNILHNIVAVYQMLTKALSFAAESNPYSYAVMNPERVGQCGLTETAKEGAGKWEEMFDKFCKFVNCQLAFDPEGKYTGLIGKWQEGGKKLMGFAGGDFVERWTGKDTNSYMNPKDSMVVSLLTACLPGIVYNLDKWRQIQCMYANCLQEGVKQQGLPVIACEDQKDYAECKYLTGEIFKVFPIAMIFDYYMNMIKDALSNPFKIIGAAVALGCAKLCPSATEGPHNLCIGVKIVSLIGQSIGDVTTMIDDGVFKIRDDYCDKLEYIEDETTSTNSTGI